MFLCLENKLLFLLLCSSRDDKDVRVFLRCASLASSGNLAPHGFRSSGAAALSAFAAAVWVVDRVHGGTAHGRAYALPARTSGLAVVAQLVFFVRNFADRGKAFFADLAHFRR